MNFHPSDDPASRIVRYLTGELSEREEVELHLVLARDPKQQQLYDELRLMWERSDTEARVGCLCRSRAYQAAAPCLAPLRVALPRRARAPNGCSMSLRVLPSCLAP